MPQLIETPYDDDSRKRADVRVIVTVKNALILKKMEAAGVDSIADLARRIGIAQGTLGRFINMKEQARTKSGEWSSIATKLSVFFHCLPEDLFSEQQQHSRLEKNKSSKDVAGDDIKSLLYDQIEMQTPEQAYLQKEGQASLTYVLSTPTENERLVLIEVYGLDGDGERTMTSIAEKLGISKGRVGQIAAKAFRKLRHPSRERLLLDYSEELSGVKR